MKKNIIAFLLFFIPFFGFADTFVVTSNADSGPGTLREAIQKAAANGITVQDSILFNINDTSVLGRTIDLKSALPFLTSNTVIDGTTQNGSNIGVSAAKVVLQVSNISLKLYFLQFQYASNIEIYGLFFYQTGSYVALLNYNSQAIHFRKSNHIIIGKPGKGNYFIGHLKAIYNWDETVTNGYTIDDSCRDIKIQSNIMGLDLQGAAERFFYPPFFNGYDAAAPETGIELIYAKDVLIGGNSNDESNFIRCKNSIILQSPFHFGTGFYKIINNGIATFFNRDVDSYGSSQALTGLVKISTKSYYTSLPANDSIDVEIKSNQIVGNIQVSDICKDFSIQSNKIYSASYFMNDVIYNYLMYLGAPLIDLHPNNNKIIFGGNNTSEGNEVFAKYFNNSGAGPTFTFGQIGLATWPDTKNGVVEIKNNVMHCNTPLGSSIYNGNFLPLQYNANSDQPWVIIDSTANNYVKGRATKNSRIDIYQDDECSGCEGKAFIGNTQSDNVGNWVYTGSFAGVVVATATNAKGHTFAFSSPYVITDSIKIIQPRCGINNGSIKGLKVIGGDNLEWRYSANFSFLNSTFLSSNLDIDNLKPGGYYIMGKLGSSCYGMVKTYGLRNYSPKINEKNAIKNNPTCGKFNGAITGIIIDSADYCKMEWRNISGIVVGNDISLRNIGDGQYKLYVFDTTGAGCIDSSSLYTLTNQSGPSININSALIKNANCEKPTGSITNITVKNVTGTMYIKWEDISGKIMANTFDLLNVPAGQYRIKLKDGGGCDTIISNYFTVLNDGVIVIDSFKSIIKASSCKDSDGSISNLIITGAESYKWFSIATNEVVSSSIDLKGAVPGYYQLILNNSLGCEKKSTIMQIPQTTFLPLNITANKLVNASCDLSNGSATPLTFSNDTTLYQFKWIGSANNILSTYTKLQQINAGTYYLNATDTNGCSQKIYTASITQSGKPLIDYSVIKIIDDECNLGKGSISNINVSGGVAPYSWQWTNSNNSIVSSSNSLPTAVQDVYQFTVTDNTGCSITSNGISIANTSIALNDPIIDGQNIFRYTKALLVVKNPQMGMYTLYDTSLALIGIDSSLTGILTTGAVGYNKYFYVRLIKGSCFGSLTPVFITVYDDTSIELPNVFSPNGDNINDLLVVKTKGIVNQFKWIIFNRSGQKVFETHDLLKPWDGTYNGKPLPIGTYYWIITASDNKNNPIKMSGPITIIK